MADLLNENQNPERSEGPNAEFQNPEKIATPPVSVEALLAADAQKNKRNSGRSGATSPQGKLITAQNATRHGCCAATLILKKERRADYENLLNRWLTNYGSPDQSTLLYTFIVKTSQSEWFRLRAQREYDDFFSTLQDLPMSSWEPAHHKTHDLLMRYVTAAKRKFQREYRMLEHHWKTHHKAAAAELNKPELVVTPKPTSLPFSVIDNETGEEIDQHRKVHPPPPGYVPKKIIPGVYDDDHPVKIGERMGPFRTRKK